MNQNTTPIEAKIFAIRLVLAELIYTTYPPESITGLHQRLIEIVSEAIDDEAMLFAAGILHELDGIFSLATRKRSGDRQP